MAIATGAPLPPGADSVLKVEYTQSPTPELIEVLRPATPGEGMVRADEDAAPGTELARPAAHCARRTWACSPPPDSPRSVTRAPARGDRLDGRRAGARDDTGDLDPGQVRDSSAPALAALVREAGGEPHFAGIVADDREALTATLRALVKGLTLSEGGRGFVTGCDVLVVSAGSSVGARDETAAAIASLGEPGIWCHGLVAEAGEADAARRRRRHPGHRAAGQPALGARRVPPDRDADRADGRRLHRATAGAERDGPPRP